MLRHHFQLLDFLHAKLGSQGFAFTMGSIFGFFKSFMDNQTELIHLAETSIISGSIFAVISLAKDAIKNKFPNYFSDSNKEDK